MIYDLYWIELAIYIGARYEELFAVIRQYVYDTHKYLALLNTALWLRRAHWEVKLVIRQ